MGLGLRLGFFVCIALCSAACGGQTDSDGGSAGGTGGKGGSGGSVGGSGGAMGGSGGSLGGSGGVGATGGSPACSVVDTGADCATLSEARCLAATKRCAPIYDDKCCPKCEASGFCADCVDYRFRECIPYQESACVPGAIGHCGLTPQWFCQGTLPDCSQHGGMCGATPGCVSVIPACPPDTSCSDSCHAVTAWSCGPSCSGAAMPSCFSTVPEVLPGGGYSGYCIAADVCTSPGCPLAIPQQGSSCPEEGKLCSWGDWCKSTCTCKNGVWDCIIPLC